MRPLPRSRAARALVAGAAVLSLAGCQPTQTADRREPQRVKTVVLAETDYEPELTLTGEVRAEFQTDVSFRVTGRILSRSAEVGDHVEVGQILAKIDPQEQNADVASAQAVLDSANAQLRQVASTYDRQKELIAKGFTTRRDYDQAEAAWRAAKASVDSAAAQLAVAQERLGDTELKAPVPGLITARNIEAGQVIQAAQPAYTIAQDGPRDAVFNVYDTLVGGGRVSPEVKIILLASPNVTVQGKVREVSPTVDMTNGTIRVKVGLIDPPAAMTLGAPVRGVAHIRPRKVIALPPRALSELGGKPAVWILDPKANTVSLRNFAVARYATDWIIVADGLTTGEIVVADGSQLLRPGETVAPVDGGAK
jgi:RND family efflux transporter MFP subunit